MATQLQLRRGTSVNHATFTGANGEITIDITNHVPRVHDGTTAGGWLPYVLMANSSVYSVLANTAGVFIGNSTANSVVFAANGNIGLGGNTTPSLLLYANGAGAGAIGTLTDAANITMNAVQYNNWQVGLGGNRNFDNPSNLVPGEFLTIAISTNTFSSPTWSSAWKFTGNTAPTLTSTAGAVDIVIGYVKNSTTISATTLLNVG